MSIYATDCYSSGTGVSAFYLCGSSNNTPVVSATVYKSGLFTRGIQDSSGTVNIAHNLGTVPKKINFNSLYRQSANPFPFCRSFGVFDSNGNNNVSENIDGVFSDTTYSINITTNSIPSQRAIISVDSTNIIINWTSSTGSSLSGDINILYSAEG